MRPHFYTLVNDLSQHMQLPFDSHMEGLRVQFQVDKDYRFGLALDHSEHFLIFECFLLDRKFLELDPLQFLRLNFTAAYQHGYFISLDPKDTVVLVTRLPLQDLNVTRVIEAMEHMLNFADRFTRGELSRRESTSPSHVLDFHSKV